MIGPGTVFNDIVALEDWVPDADGSRGWTKYLKEKLRNFYTVVSEGHVRKAVLLAGLGPADADWPARDGVQHLWAVPARPAAGGIGGCAEELTRGRGSGTAVTYVSST